jgi:hypothetical protein
MRPATRATCALILGLAALCVLPAGALASPVPLPARERVSLDADFPPADSRYHNYAEMSAEIAKAATDHPNIVRRFSLGNTYQGRAIWIVKISDNPNVDENEPEVLLDAQHHAREHLTVEMALYTLKVLTDDYGTDPTVTTLVNHRETFIIFSLNPDGSEFDLTGTPYRAWRKNRQPNANSQHVGTDLNRNYGYRWNCCGGSSGDPSSLTYRGSAPWSAVEARRIRDFVDSRVIGGRQQIKTHITFHTNGELILWPYGYTKTDVPSDMTADDHRAFVAMARQMASQTGYRAQQSSDLYITDGDQIDWMYGVHRIFSYTFELFPTEHYTVQDFYPADEHIAAQTARMRPAVLHMISQADCPWRASGLTRTHCGAFNDDFEGATGWRRDPFGTDTATGGIWTRANPEGTADAGGAKQLNTTTSGSLNLHTGKVAGASATANDLDGGRSSVLSPTIALPATAGQTLTFRYYLAHDATSSAADYLRVSVVSGGVRTLVHQEVGGADDDDAKWWTAVVDMTPWAGKSISVLIEAADLAGGSLVEAAVDDLRVTRP